MDIKELIDDGTFTIEEINEIGLRRGDPMQGGDKPQGPQGGAAPQGGGNK